MPKFNAKPPYTDLKIVVRPMSRNQNTGRFTPGKLIKFQNGTYETNDKEELKVLRDPERGFGAYIFEEKEERAE
jgi:hypothetical protein